MTPENRPRANLSLIGFLAMAFVVVGLTGILATYAAPLPLARALHLEAVLDQALARGDVAGVDAQIRGKKVKVTRAKSTLGKQIRKE